MNKITVYHGTFRKFSNPSIEKGKQFLDFGKGFYVTENFYDALNMLKGKPGYIYEYELELTGEIKEFQNNSDLLNYIIKNRIENVDDQVDFVIGGTLPGCSKIFKDFRNKGVEIDKELLMNKLESSPYSDQICIKTEVGLSKLKLADVHTFNSDDFILG